MPTLGYIGEKLDLLIRQGATLGPFNVTLTNPNGTPYDLTGVTIRGQIRKTPSDPVVTADLDVSVIDSLLGKFEFGISSVLTAQIPTGESLKDTPSGQVWDMELVDTLGRVTPLYYGDVKVFREVTRA